LSDLFLSIRLQAEQRFEVKIETAHLDSTSFHVDGEYEDTADTSEPEAVKITYGYSRDHRPDLKQFVLNLVCVGDGDKQFVLNLVCVGDGDIPVLMDIASGGADYGAVFADLQFGTATTPTGVGSSSTNNS
jgi:hypothetical protein